MLPEGLQENFYYGGGATESSFTVVSLIVLFLGIILVLVLPRKRMLYPFFVIGLLLPGTQVLVIPGMHLAVYRILLLAMWARIVVNKWVTRQDSYTIQMNTLDKVFVGWALSNAIAYSLLWHEVAAVINRLGFLSVSLGVYFMMRYVVRDRDDVMNAIRALAFTVTPVALVMIYEHYTGVNAVTLLLGAGKQLAEVRNERIRAQGPFSHSIVAGTLGAMLLPLFIGLWAEGQGNRLRAALGMLSSAVITIASASSTPLMTFLAGIGGVSMWPLRRHMRVVRWGMVFMLVLLQIVMKAPVWFLINRMSLLTGGTGWHRAELVDQFIRRFFEWCLIGTQNNANWGLDMWDAINAYVRAGVEGGLVTFVLFLAIIIIGYRRVGLARASVDGKDGPNEFLIWTLGVALFGNTVAFFGIIYFDQSVTAWYSLLAMISVVSGLYIQAPEPAASHRELLRSMNTSGKTPAVPSYRTRNKPEKQRVLASPKMVKNVAE